MTLLARAHFWLCVFCLAATPYTSLKEAFLSFFLIQLVFDCFLSVHSVLWLLPLCTVFYLPSPTINSMYSIPGPFPYSLLLVLSCELFLGPNSSPGGGGEKVRSQWYRPRESSERQTTHSFTQWWAKSYILLPAPRLYPNLMTMHGHPSLARHNQELWQHPLLGP